MPNPYRVKITSAGISTDLFNVLYSTVGSTALNTAYNACGTPVSLLTKTQITNGVAVYLPDNAQFVYVFNAAGGPCVGTYASYEDKGEI